MATCSGSQTAEDEERITAKTPRGRESATGRSGFTQPLFGAADKYGMSRLEPPRYLDDLASSVIGAAIEVHRLLGPGFLECIYEAGMAKELTLRGIPHAQQVPLAIVYKDELIGEHRLDLLIAGELVVELKAVDRISSAHVAQTLSYLRAGGFRLGLVLNFHGAVLRDGIRRVICPY